MSPPVGWLVDDADPALAEAVDARFRRVAVAPTPAAVATAEVEAWVVDAAVVEPPVLQVVRDGHVPAVFLVAPSAARSWHRVVRKGVHDVVWTPAGADELVARLRGLLARQRSWNEVSTALCREIAHDLRSPLQALNFTVAALENEGALGPEYAEDVEDLLAALDKAGLLLDGVSNQGRRALEVPDDTPAVDVAELARTLAARPAFAGAVTVEGREPLPVRGPPDMLRSAVQDVLRVAWERAANRQQVRVQGVRFGDMGVLTATARAYEPLLENLPALLFRERPVLLKRQRVPMPLGGLAYAREVARSLGGDVTVRREDRDVRVELQLPLA